MTQAMCLSEKQAPGSVAAALAAMDGILGYLREPGTTSLLSSELGETLAAMGVLSSKFAAVRAGVMARFDAERAYTDDGYGSTSAWLKGWRLVLHPDGTTTAYGPKGQVLHSHGPPRNGPPGNGPPEDSGPSRRTGPPGTKAA